MKQRSKKTAYSAKKKSLILAITIALVALIGLGTVFGVAKMRYYKDTVDQASTVSMRELVLLAVKGLKKDAPVDARTGDIYFPESKLYLPNPKLPLTVTYLFDTGDITNSQSELSVSTYPLRGTEALYSARNDKELFVAIPKLQACSRGIKIVHQKFPASDTQNILKQTVHLNNGQDIYVYLENDCPELGATADLFANIKAY